MGAPHRLAAARTIGLALNLAPDCELALLPDFLGSDIVFVFAWLPFVLAAPGEPTAAALIARRPPGLRRAQVPAHPHPARAAGTGARARRRGHGGRGGSIDPGPSTYWRPPGHARLGVESQVTSGLPPPSRRAIRRRTPIPHPASRRWRPAPQRQALRAKRADAPTPAARSSTTAMRSPARATTRPSTSAAGHRSVAPHAGRWPLLGSPSATAASWRARCGRRRCEEHPGRASDGMSDLTISWLGQDPLYEAELACTTATPPPPGALVPQRAGERPGCVAQRAGQQELESSSPPSAELLRLHVIRVRTAGLRRGGRHGLHRRPGAHLRVRRRSAAHLHPAGHAGVPARGRRVEGGPSPWRHGDRTVVSRE